MKKFLILFLVFIGTAYADDASVGYGLGVAESAINSRAETKTFNLAYRSDLLDGIYWQLKGGYWGDGSGDPARSSSGFVSSGFGLRVDLTPVELRSGWGLATITSPDSYLGGRFPQFNGDFYLGLRDKHGSGIGFEYDHISSAGIIKPNQGRDFITLQLSQRW